MPFELAISNSIAIALAFFMVAEKFMLPNRWAKLGCFISLFVIEFACIQFAKYVAGFTEGAFVICCFAMSFFMYANLKNYLKSFDIALSIILVYTILAYLIGAVLVLVLPVFIELDTSEDSIVASIIFQICLIALSFPPRMYKDYLFIPSEDKKLMQFHLVSKVLLFILLNFAVQILIDPQTKLYFWVMLSLSIITVINFFFVKYTTKRIAKLENDNRMAAIAFNKRQEEAKSINTRYDDIVKFKHYYTNLYRMIVHYINDENWSGLREYYNENIAPIHEQLRKEIEAYDQIKYIHIEILKARIVELINTVSQLPNVEFILHMDSQVYSVEMSEIDLYKIVNILIDNALEEVKNHENGVIRIEMGQTEVSFFFQIRNTMKGFDSTPKPDNTHMGLTYVREIKQGYTNVSFATNLHTYGYYEQNLVVSND